MGSELKCSATYGGRQGKGTALLETDHIVFRGDFRVKVPFASIEGLEVLADDLVIHFGGEQLTLNIGVYAPKWKQKIEHPPTLLDKLGVKPGLRIAALNVSDGDFVASLAEQEKGELDILFLGAETDTGLEKIIAREMKRLCANGSLWVIYPKGVKTVTEIGVLRAGRTAGLKDVKVAAFSKTYTALKFMIPVAMRKAKSAAK